MTRHRPQGKAQGQIFQIQTSRQRLIYCLHIFLIVTLITPCAGAGVISWRSPVAGQLTVVEGFEKPEAKWGTGHRGVDLVLEAEGQILAPAEGRVTFSGTVVDRQVITLEHPDGRKSSFEPVTDPLPVGTVVTAGTPIARLDPQVQHCLESHCLHWGVREPAHGQPTADKGMDYINPLLLLGLEKPSVLLPIGGDFAA